MADEECWGPWVEHDGKGCPVVGRAVESETRDGDILQHIAHGHLSGNSGIILDCWDWGDPLWAFFGDNKQIIRYRIRKPKGLTVLEEIIADIPAPTKPKVDA